jgi:hypothetical protein
LQWDRAEFSGPAVATCASCSQPLRDAYYEAHGRHLCPACGERLRASLADSSGPAPMLRSVAAGLAAAAAGAVLYYAIFRFTGYEFGLIAIVVGVAVGKAVSWGSDHRGGWRYQALAMLLTYVAIVSSYLPLIFADAFGDGTILSHGLPALLGMLAIACTAPFQGGFSNVLGLVIIGIGLYEAWKLNRRRTLVITGPHVLAPTPAASAAP